LALGGFLGYFVYYDVFRYTYTILAAGMIGALVAFLYFNLFGTAEKNTKIFMGDSGSLSLGYTLGFLAIKTAMDHPTIWFINRPEAFLYPLTLLFVPIADVVRVTLYRLFHGYPLFDADKNHIHHKLMRAGLTQHQALAVILLITIGIYAINYMLYPTLSSTVIVGIDTLIYIMVNITINLRIKSIA
jgi:UDP-N-acetylmuramyl pentapeptide phosphotransferase/UDP-N-acetylglucosamine-1-phosphate transferase